MQLVILGLEISGKHQKEWIQFQKMDVFKKIDLIKERITQLYPRIQEEMPDSLVLVVLKEYAINSNNHYEKSPDKRIICFLDQNAKDQFTKSMKELTRQHPNLIILGGSLLVEKTYDSSEADNVYRKLKSSYENTAEIGELEKNHVFAGDRLWTRAHEMIKPENFPKNDKKIHVTQNIAYLIQNGEIIHKYNKMNPIALDFSQHTFFYPGKKNNSNFFVIKHPSTQEEILCALEICKDHASGTVANVLAKNPEQPIPMIHIIISDTVSVNPDAMFAAYTNQQDSANNSRFIVSDRLQPEHKHCQVYCLSHNLFSHTIDYTTVTPAFSHALQKPDDIIRSEIPKLVEEEPSTYTNYQVYFALHNAICTQDTAVLKMLLQYASIEDIFHNYQSLHTNLNSHTYLREIAKNTLDPGVFKTLPQKNYQEIYDSLKDGEGKYNIILNLLREDSCFDEFVQEVADDEAGENFQEFRA